MISFNLTALTQPTLSIQRKSKPRDIFPRKIFKILPNFHSYFQSSTNTVAFLQNLVYSITALKHFKERAFADMTTTFRIEEDEEPMATEPIYLSSDESEYSTPNTTPDHQPECIYPDSINQLIASQLEQRSYIGTETIVYPPTPNTSVISDDEDPMNPAPIIENPAQYTPQIIPRRNHPIQICQNMQPIPDTPQSPTPENRGQSDDFYPDNIPLHNPPNIIAVTDELNNLTLHPHPQRNEWATACLVCGKSYDQVIDETVADYLDQTAQPGETVRERQIKRNAFIDGVQSGVFTFIPPGVSQAAACDGMIYSVNYNGQNSVTQGHALPLFED